MAPFIEHFPQNHGDQGLNAQKPHKNKQANKPIKTCVGTDIYHLGDDNRTGQRHDGKVPGQ